MSQPNGDVHKPRSLSGLSSAEFLARYQPHRRGMPPRKTVPVVPFIWIQNLDDGQCAMVMVGAEPNTPIAGVPCSAMELRQIAAAFEEHARLLDEAAPPRSVDDTATPEGDVDV